MDRLVIAEARRCVIALAAAATVIGGCSSVDGPPVAVSRDVVSAPASASATVPLSSAEPSVPAAATTVIGRADQPRVITYGMLTWTIVDAAITRQDPATYVAGAINSPTAETSLIVDFEVRNDDVHVTFLNTTARLVATLPDGTVIPGSDLTRRAPRPQSTVNARYAFSVPDGTSFDDLVLSFQDPGREPSLGVPLGGHAPPVESHLTLEPDAVLELGIPGVDMRWTIDSLRIGRDWPLPVGFKGGALVPSTRAALDRQWVGITARVEVGRCDCRGGILDQSASVRLLIDDLPFTAVAAHSTRPILGSSSFSEVMLVFDLPASAGEVTFQVGPIEEAEQQATTLLALD